MQNKLRYLTATIAGAFRHSEFLRCCGNQQDSENCGDKAAADIDQVSSGLRGVPVRSVVPVSGLM